jgi:TRAP-type C4-dicarboxylate transport system permease small subunit
MSPADDKPPAAAAAPMSLARRLFVRIPYLIAGSLLLAAIAINMANVIGRYVFATPVFWAEEVLSFMIIWSVCVAAGAISYQGAHVTMDLLAAALGPGYRAFIGVLTVACSAFVVTQTVRILALYQRTGETSMAARFPLLYAHSAVLVGFALMGIVALIRARAHVRNTFD